MGDWLGCDRGGLVCLASAVPCEAWVCGRLDTALALAFQAAGDVPGEHATRVILAGGWWPTAA